jgi:prophage DNA circulation protein
MSGSLLPVLRPASYRGVMFYVESAGGEHGQRFADHIYPGRDTPYAEPLGRAQRVWPITGYVLGPAFRMARDALIRAVEREGTGELVHPALGILEVNCRIITWTETRDARGRATFQLEFAEPGSLEEPTGEPNAEMLLEAAADELGLAAAAAFLDVANGGFSVTGTLSYVATDAQTDVQYMAVTLEDARMPAAAYDQAPVEEAIANLRQRGPDLVFFPAQLVIITQDAFAAFSNGGEPYAVGSAMLQIANSYTAGARASDVSSYAYVPIYPASERRTINQWAWQSFCRQQALREVGYATPAFTIESYDEAMALIVRVTEAFEVAELAAADAGLDNVFIALIRLRSTIIADIQARNAGNVPLVHYETLQTENALVMAWRFYRDAGRNLELVEAVRARTPCFMPRRGRVKAA